MGDLGAVATKREREWGEETCVSNEDGKGERWIKRQP